MLVRRKKSLSIIFLGVAFFVITGISIPKLQLSSKKNNDTKTGKRSTTEISLETSQRLKKAQDVEKREKKPRKETLREKSRQNYSQLSQNSEKTHHLSSKNPQETYSSQGFQQVGNKDNAQPRKRYPTVIILGVKKAGTRALLEILQMHPKVIGAPNEVYFFNGFHKKGLEWYRQQMPLSRPDQITIEKSPTYFTSFEKTQVVNRMFVFSRSIPNILKLLVVVRDPTQRCLSEYTDLLARSQKGEIPPVRENFENLISHKNGSINANSSLVKTGLYTKHLKEWLQYFPPNEIHFVSGEGLVRTPYKEIKVVEKFIGLEPFFTEKNFRFNRKKAFPCFVSDPSKGNVTKCLPGNKGRKHVKVTQRTLELLREFYRPYNKQFYKSVKRNFFWS